MTHSQDASAIIDFTISASMLAATAHLCSQISSTDVYNQNNISLGRYIAIRSLSAIWMLYPRGFEKQKETQIDDSGLLTALPTPFSKDGPKYPGSSF